MFINSDVLKQWSRTCSGGFAHNHLIQYKGGERISYAGGGEGDGETEVNRAGLVISNQRMGRFSDRSGSLLGRIRVRGELLVVALAKISR